MGQVHKCAYRACWGLLSLLICAEASALEATKVVARDIRKIGNGNCVASVAVRYNEPIENPWTQQARLLKSSRRVVQCTKAQATADGLIRDLESDLLLQAQRRADVDNALVHSVTLADAAYVRTQATSESPLLKVLPAGTRIHVRSLTPTWYGLTDARGNPTDGFLHYSELAGEFSAPQRVFTTMTAACAARVRSKPSADAPIVQSLRCGQPLHVVSVSGGWYEVASSDGKPIGQYVHSAVLTPAHNRMQ
jgi:uncharacterized protein YgiM (DUF1202 family)